MAENIYIEFTADTSGLKAAQNELDVLKQKITGATTEGAKGVGNFSQRLKEGKAAIQLMSGAMGLFGDKSQAVVQIIHKIHAALNLLKGVNTLTGLSAAFSGVTLSVNSARAAVTALGTVIKTNPFGLLLSALATVTVAMNLFNDETEKAIDNTDQLKKAQEELNATYDLGIAATKARHESEIRSQRDQIKLLELNGAKSKEILAAEIALVEKEKKQNEEMIPLIKARYGAYSVELKQAENKRAEFNDKIKILNAEFAKDEREALAESIKARKEFEAKRAAGMIEGANSLSQLQIDLMAEGQEKQLAQEELNHNIRIAELTKKYVDELKLYGVFSQLYALEVQKHEKNIAALKIKGGQTFGPSREGFDMVASELKTLEETEQRKKELREQIARDTVAALSEIWTAYSQQNIDEIEHELEAKNEMFDKELEKNQERRDREIISDREFRAKEKELLAQKERAEREAQKRILAEKRKMALIEKAEALFSIGMSTAKNIVAGPLALIPFWIALGAIQAGVVAATPLPKYASGTLSLQRGGNPVGTDTIPILANEGEAITPTPIAKDYNTTLAAMHKRSIPHRVMNDFVKNYSMKYYNRNETNFDYEKLGASLAYHLRGKDSMRIKNIDEFARVFSYGSPSPFRT